MKDLNRFLQISKKGERKMRRIERENKRRKKR